MQVFTCMFERSRLRMLRDQAAALGVLGRQLFSLPIQSSRGRIVRREVKHIPETTDALVLRTDFSDAAAWKSVCAAIRNPVTQFLATVEFVSDPAFDGIPEDQLPSLIAEASNRTFMFVVDRTTLSQPEHPILVMDLYTEPGRTFRVIPSEMWSIENNLSIANMDFDEFAESADEDGVFRGFPQS